MRYVLAVLLPPLAMLLCGKIFQAILALIFMCTLIGWPLASIWAFLVVNNYFADRRTDRMIQAINQQQKD